MQRLVAAICFLFLLSFIIFLAPRRGDTIVLCCHDGPDRDSSAAASVLASAYGNDTSFTVISAGLPGVQRDFTSFSSAVQQVEDARIYAGFHFRFSCTDAATLGTQVAQYVTNTLMQRLGRTR